MAQDPPEAAFPYRRDIEKQKYDRVAQKLSRHLRRDSNNLEWHYAAYRLFSTPEYSRYHTDSAYLHLATARRLFDQASPKNAERWSRDSYSGALFDYDLRRVSRMALEGARLQDTPDAYNHFLAFYTLAPDDLLDSATLFRDTVEFRYAALSGTIEMLDDFIARRPGSVLADSAAHLRDSMVFAIADRAHTPSAYSQFLADYPNSHLRQRATDSLHLVAFRDAKRYDTEQYYRAYADSHPNSPYAQQSSWLADSIEYHRTTDTTQWHSLLHYADLHHNTPWHDSALLSLSGLALRQHNIEAAAQSAYRLPAGSPRYRQIASMLHESYIHTSIRNFQLFYQRFPNLMDAETRRRDSLAYNTYLNYDFRNADSCIRAVAPSHEAIIMLQQLIKDDIDHGRIRNAYGTVQAYSSCFGQNYEYGKLLGTLSAESDSPSKNEKSAQPLSKWVNTADGDEYAPVPSADGRTIYFAGRNRPGNIGGEDVFVTRRTRNGWSEPTIELDLSHFYGNEVPLSISPDGNSLLLYQSGLLYQAERTETGWKKSPMSVVDRTHTLTDAHLAADGRTLFLTLRGQTPREVDSSLNIYVCFLDSNGLWSHPIELGRNINTPFDERAPFLHPDMHTLYFSSEGHGALGQMDVFMSTRLDDTYTRWTTPINIGHEINTSDDDWGHKISTDGKRCYFSRRDKSQNIYSADMPSKHRPKHVTAVSGTVKDASGRPVATQLCWRNDTSGQVIGQCNTHPTQGTFLVLLPAGKMYTLFINDSRFPPTPYQIDLTENAPDNLAPIVLTTTATDTEQQ